MCQASPSHYRDAGKVPALKFWLDLSRGVHPIRQGFVASRSGEQAGLDAKRAKRAQQTQAGGSTPLLVYLC